MITDAYKPRNFCKKNYVFKEYFYACKEHILNNSYPGFTFRTVPQYFSIIY